MKKLLSILFAGMLLLSGMHMSMATHLCGGELAAVKWSFSGEMQVAGWKMTIKPALWIMVLIQLVARIKWHSILLTTITTRQHFRLINQLTNFYSSYMFPKVLESNFSILNFLQRQMSCHPVNSLPVPLVFPTFVSSEFD